MNANLNETSPSNPKERDFLPGSVLILILGILSVALSWLYGAPGLICGICSLRLSRKAFALNQPVARYPERSLKTIRAGRVWAITGTILSVVFLIFLLIKFFL